MKNKKIIITTGGTGGHVFPAQGLAYQLRQVAPDIEILFVGGGLSTNRYFDRNQSTFHEVSCSTIKKGFGSFKIAQGTYQSYRIIKEFQPDLMVGFGSYYTVPPLLAAKISGVPIILHEANSVPGKVNKWFAPYVKAVGVHFPQTISLLQGHGIEVGLPLRAGFSRGSTAKKEALLYFGLEDDKLTLLIFGGSQGAKAMNQCIKRCSSFNNLQIIHFTGSDVAAKELTDFYREHKVKSCVKSFESHMNLAWAASDLFLGRAGASTISEALEFEVPGILIPYPAATDNHQEKNADYLVETVKGAVKLLEKEMTPETILQAIDLMSKAENLKIMRQNMRNYKEQPSRIDLCSLVMSAL